MDHHKRPINLDLTSFSYPPMVIASILHRISGVVLFLLLPMMLYFFSLSLQSSISFSQLQAKLGEPGYKFFLWAFGAALIYHVLAGIRHLVMDCGWGESLVAARRSAQVVIVLALILMLGFGVVLW